MALPHGPGTASAEGQRIERPRSPLRAAASLQLPEGDRHLEGRHPEQRHTDTNCPRAASSSSGAGLDLRWRGSGRRRRYAGWRSGTRRSVPVDREVAPELQGVGLSVPDDLPPCAAEWPLDPGCPRCGARWAWGVRALAPEVGPAQGSGSARVGVVSERGSAPTAPSRGTVATAARGHRTVNGKRQNQASHLRQSHALTRPSTREAKTSEKFSHSLGPDVGRLRVRVTGAGRSLVEPAQHRLVPEDRVWGSAPSGSRRGRPAASRGCPCAGAR